MHMIDIYEKEKTNATGKSRLIDRWMVFNAIFNSISVIPWRPLCLCMLSRYYFNQYSTQYSFQATGCFPHLTIVETTDSGQRKMNPVAMTIINPRKGYRPGIEPATSFSQVCNTTD